jgi:hypothetical protein
VLRRNRLIDRQGANRRASRVFALVPESVQMSNAETAAFPATA